MTKSEAGSLDSTGPNPFAERPSTARTNSQNKAYLDTAMEELDRESNCPEGVPPQVWQRLCMYRRQKVEYENQVGLCFVLGLAKVPDFFSVLENDGGG